MKYTDHEGHFKTIHMPFMLHGILNTLLSMIDLDFNVPLVLVVLFCTNKFEQSLSVAKFESIIHHNMY